MGLENTITNAISKQLKNPILDVLKEIKIERLLKQSNFVKKEGASTSSITPLSKYLNFWENVKEWDVSEKICRTGRSQFKDFFACRSLLYVLPEGCSAFAHTLRWIFLNSLRRVLQKSALIMNEITASKIKVFTLWSNKIQYKAKETIYCEQ